MWIVIISALISWVNPDPYNPIVRFLHSVTDPVFRRIRRIIGYRLGPIDISPMVVILGIMFVKYFIIQSLIEFAYKLKGGIRIMRITPLDIQQKQFPMKIRGFDVEEVYAFLEVIREEMEDLLRENASLKESVQRLENQLKEHRDMETTLRETLMTAQQMVEDYKTNARKEAELVVKEAELRSDSILKEAQEKVIKIHEDIVDLKGIRRHFKEEIKRLVESHLKMLEFDREREEGQEKSYDEEGGDGEE